MSNVAVTLETTSALFLGGAYGPKTLLGPEIRAAPFRGVLRFWLRALLANQHIEIEDLRRAEINVFGGTVYGAADPADPQRKANYGGVSPVVVRVTAASPMPIEVANRKVLPHRLHGQGTKPAIGEGNQFKLVLSPRLGTRLYRMTA